jgi:hypothetical protein
MSARQRTGRQRRRTTPNAELAPGLPNRYVGPGWFGPAYASMMRYDPHRHGSVDRDLLRSMVGLDETSSTFLYRDFTPQRVAYRTGTRPILDAIANEVVSAGKDDESRVRSIVRFVSGLRPVHSEGLKSIRFGGTEEEIIARGTDWCTDSARVGCALLQAAGFPSRLVQLADTRRAYSGHTLLEAFRRGSWGAVDPLTNVVYLTPNRAPAPAWSLMINPDWIRRAYRGPTTPYARAGQFRRAAISNYVLGRLDDHDYSVGGINAYYRSILKMSERGWPGGLRWLHGEGEHGVPRA